MIVESFLEFMQSAAVHQSPRSYTMYGANPKSSRTNRLADLVKSLRHKRD
jgi:hypothetical protein